MTPDEAMEALRQETRKIGDPELRIMIELAAIACARAFTLQAINRMADAWDASIERVFGEPK